MENIKDATIQYEEYDHNSTNILNVHKRTIVDVKLMNVTQGFVAPVSNATSLAYSYPVMNSTVGTTELWWLSTQLDILVSNPTPSAGKILQYIVIVLTFINIVGMGGQVNGDDVVYLLKRPVAVGSSVLCRFGVIPAVSSVSYT